LGTLIVKPRRHVTRVSELSSNEADELGPLLQRTAAAVDKLTDADQVYVCLWSHAGGQPVHIHFVVQPATPEVIEAYGGRGPRLQAAMFEGGADLRSEEVESFAAAARAALLSRP
jgi:diadenosine tetraphosphate (Ap4A) HIT family hydrolase